MPRVQVQTLVRPQFAAVESACKDFAPDVLYIAGQTSYDQTSGTVGALQFAGGRQSLDPQHSAQGSAVCRNL